MLDDDKKYLMMALEEAKGANCIKGQVGAVIVKHNKVLARGNNSVPLGVEPCTDETCIRKKLNLKSGENQELCFVIHAEQNALIGALNRQINVRDSKIYVTKQPCIICSKMLINAGIKEIIYLQPYPDKYSEQVLKEAGIKIKCCNLIDME